jgi:hypothetical protein
MYFPASEMVIHRGRLCPHRNRTSPEGEERFYTRALSSKGWNAPKEEFLTKWFEQDGSKRLIFRKGEYTIDVEHAAGRESNWQFAVDYAWDEE